jgi:hypothetical protein
MNGKSTTTEVILMNGIPRDVSRALDRPSGRFSSWTYRRKRWLLGGLLIISALITFPNPARAQLGDIFSKLFSSIKSDMGSSLSDINKITQSLQKLYQTTMWPLAAINQSRGFVVNSISNFRNAMNQTFSTRFSSATLAGPQQFESILHSRLSTQIPALQTSFSTNFGTIPQSNMASPQDRVMMDIDDALGQENLKSTLISDQGSDTILQTANQMENQVAVSTPGSNPYITAQAQVVNLRCQAFMQKMLAAELRQEAGRIAHDNVLIKRRTSSASGINGLITGSLTAR